MPLSRRTCRTLLVALVCGAVGACGEPIAPEGQVRVEITAIRSEATGSIALDFSVMNRSSVPVRLFGCGAPFTPVIILRADGTEDVSQQWCLGIQLLQAYRLGAGATWHGTRVVPASAGARYRLGVRFYPSASLQVERTAWASDTGPL